MRVVGRTNCLQVLADWAMHEARGRLGMAAALEPLAPQEARLIAALTLLKVRPNVIAAILAAEPIECVRVELHCEDIPRVLTMGALPLERFAANMIEAHDVDGSGDWVRGLADGPDISGPFLAVARSADGPITLFDGLHRAAAWVAHCNADRVYPLVVDVVITAQPAPRFEFTV